MKNRLIIILLLLSVLGINEATAQRRGDVAVGASLGFGSFIPTASIGLNAQYNLTNEIRLVSNFDYFIKNKGVSTFDFTFDAHYIFPINDIIATYPIVGMGLSTVNLSYAGSRVPFVVNIGGGIQYKISNELRANFEIKGRVGNHVSQLVIGPSISYMF